MKRTDQGRKDLKSKKPVAFDFVGVCYCLCFAALPPTLMSTLTDEKKKRRKEEDLRSEERI